mgnify:CR=1 FL=1|jgi:hypothetical protein
MDLDAKQLELYLNNKKRKKTVVFSPTLVVISCIAITKGYYLALCLIFLLFLCSLLTRFFRHFQRIVAHDFLNRHECDINIYRY